MRHLLEVSLRTPPPEASDHFPFSVPSIRSLFGQTIQFDQPVTFFIGENGSGKSTLLEALAIAVQSITVGSSHVERDESLESGQQLARELKLSWKKRTHRGFFMRSEDFFGYARRMHRERAEFAEQLRKLEAEPDLSDLARSQARMPLVSSLRAMEQMYDEGLDTFSHGESYFTLFRSRFAPNGLYLLDEPEAPLSPMRQLGLLSLIKQMVEEQNAQFIIASHSPILMAYPQAQLLSFDGGHVRPISFEQIEHVNFMRDFLNHPQRFLRHL
jgi:predicted ATPase